MPVSPPAPEIMLCVCEAAAPVRVLWYTVTMARRLSTVCAVCLALAPSLLLTATSLVTDAPPPLVLVISFDGFRWDYLDVAKLAGHRTPNFDALIANGVQAKWVVNSFTTLTFPNHYTIATGLYEENHGVVSNRMYDPVLNETFDGKNGSMQESNWWNNGTDQWAGEPIWLTNQQISGHRSGVYYWIGSEAAIKGKRPYRYEHYNWSMPFHQRVDTVVDWFTEEHSPINLGMLYFEEPDNTGHSFGPDSPEVLAKVLEMDSLLGYLVESFEDEGLFERLDLIVTSDHGMAEMTDDVIYLEDYVASDSYAFYGETPVVHILPEEGLYEEVYRGLSEIPNVQVYEKNSSIPREYHYRYNRRIMPIVLEAHEGVTICQQRDGCKTMKGNHGYNNSLPDMWPVFIAHGPSFREGYASPPIHNVDIYPLLCRLLGVPPAEHDGSLAVVTEMLKPAGAGGEGGDRGKDATHQETGMAVGIVFGVLLVVSGLYCLLKLSSATSDSKRAAAEERTGDIEATRLLEASEGEV